MSNPAAIEFFLWTQDKAKEKLVYYDQKGNYYEKPVDPKILEQILKLFDGRPRAVARSSGGLILVQPYQIIVLEKNENGVTVPDIRIRVRFRDLKRNARHEILGREVVINTKVVLPSELKEPFAYETREPQNFVVDLGRGIIPVHVFDYYYDANSQIMAKFIHLDTLEKIAKDPAGNRANVTVYEIPRDVLRVVQTEGSKGGKDFETAKEHAKRLVARGEVLIPDFLKTGEQVSVPTGSSTALARQFLRVSCKSSTLQDVEAIYLNIRDKDENLIPFGLFEEE